MSVIKNLRVSGKFSECEKFPDGQGERGIRKFFGF
jgi:hypothetical protein